MDGFFACNICLDMASDPVLTRCGHLYCWSCLYRWMRTQKGETLCPICKVHVSDHSVIPIYGRGHDESLPRPTPVYTEAASANYATPCCGCCGSSGGSRCELPMLESLVPARPTGTRAPPSPMAAADSPPRAGDASPGPPDGWAHAGVSAFSSALGLPLVFNSAVTPELSAEQVRARAHNEDSKTHIFAC